MNGVAVCKSSKAVIVCELVTQIRTTYFREESGGITNGTLGHRSVGEKKKESEADDHIAFETRHWKRMNASSRGGDSRITGRVSVV